MNTVQLRDRWPTHTQNLRTFFAFNAVSLLCPACSVLHCFGKQRFSVSQNAAAEASNRQLHISTSKGLNGCRFNETLKRLVTIPQDLWIITLIPAWDHENFVWRIWNHCERCDSIEKLAISTFAHRSCLLLFGAKIFLSFRLNNLIVSYNSFHVWVSSAHANADRYLWPFESHAELAHVHQMRCVRKHW